MRKAQKQEILDFIESLHQAHEEIREALKQKNTASAKNMLAECQEFAVTLGETIEKLEGEGHVTVSFVEEYCETLFHVFEEITQQDMNENRVHKVLRRQLLKVENSVKNDIPVRKEIVFFPYKASMWDSLESIYLAAKEDSECDAYCVPIPYFDLKPDHSFGQMHYEGGEYPENIEITNWENYNFEERKPDAIFIHNPYDDWNRVTSVHPRYYSANLKKYTDLLVYVPYYITSGGMTEGQSLCSAYLYADYIVVQAPKYIAYFDKNIPRRKFLPFGSPKADKVVRLCQNPPELPVCWKERIEGKKVYFYNTSIGGMLGNTKQFLLKMEYVFRCFLGRTDACLLWRPHPLLESTFDSMRKEYRPVYDRLKRYFIESGLGIYDDTPEIEKTIAWCDAYIGDEGSSVTSLFGIAGKPVFILDNYIIETLNEDSWRKEIIKGVSFSDGYDDRWMITQGNRLYYSPGNNYRYEWYCDLSEYSYGNPYLGAYEINGKVYVCPINAQEILIIENRKNTKRIRLESAPIRTGAFRGIWIIDKYLFLIPFRYPAIVRYDTEKDKVDYLEGYNEIFVQNVQGKWRIGGICTWNNFLMLSSPTDNRVLVVDSITMKAKIIFIGGDNYVGSAALILERNSSESEIWVLPYEGYTVKRWNPETGEVCCYNNMPEGFFCGNHEGEKIEDICPFGWITSYKDKMILSPAFGNMFVAIDRDTSVADKWEFPIGMTGCGNTGLFFKTLSYGKTVYRFYSAAETRLYELDMENDDCKEIPIIFRLEELQKHEPGFGKDSEWLVYACRENAINSLCNFLDGRICGNDFDVDRQKMEYRKVIENNDGSCGEKIYQFISKNM